MPKKSNVGYGTPPKHAQFKPGQSGNPNGRPKGTKNLKTDLAEELAEMIPAKENGKIRKISKQRAMLKSLTAKAIKGDTRASTVLIAMIDQHLSEDDGSASTPELTKTDLEVLQAFKNQILQECKRED